MDTVTLTASVRLWHGPPPEESAEELRIHTVIQGVGSGEGRDWLRDVLVAAIEEL